MNKKWVNLVKNLVLAMCHSLDGKRMKKSIIFVVAALSAFHVTFAAEWIAGGYQPPDENAF